MELIARLQNDIAPDVFTPRAVYDGRKNMFAPRALPLGPTGSREVRCATVTRSRSHLNRLQFPFPPVSEKSRPLKVRLTEVAKINPE